MAINPRFLDDELGPWASDRAFTVDDGRATFSGRQANFFPLEIGPNPAFSFGDSEQIQLMDRPMWISATQDSESGTITLALDDGNTAGQVILIAKAWLWERGFLGLEVTHEDGTSVQVAESEDGESYVLDVPHFSELLLDDSVVLSQLGSGPILPHPSQDVHWDPDNLTMEVDIDNYLVSYTVYFNKTWMDTEMPEPLLDTFTWTVQNVNGEPYYKVVLSAAQTPVTLQVESTIRVWWEALEDGGSVLFETPNYTLTIPVNVTSTFVLSNESIVPDFADPNATFVETKVLRGRDDVTNATAIVVLHRDYVGAVVNHNGSYRHNIPSVPFTAPTNNSTSGVEHGESALLSKFIWNDNAYAIDPVNALFYDKGGQATDALLHAGWSWTDIGSWKEMFFGDEIHGGSDTWTGVYAHYQDQEEAGGYGDRFHLRTFYSATGDTHTPGFGYYMATPVHWEEGLFHSVVSPQAGQDYLVFQMAASTYIGNIWLTQVTNNAGCSNCAQWDGWVDIYQIGQVDSDPCGQPTVDDSVLTNFVHCTCPTGQAHRIAAMILPSI